MQVFTQAEAAAALFQASVTLGLALIFAFLHRRYRKPHFFWWSVAFGLYGLGLAAIVTFLVTEIWAFLYWHQVVTGWTALALLYAALVFERQLVWRGWFAALLAFPLAWSYVAIFILDDFGLAAGATVVFLSATTLWTGRVFWRYHRRTGSSAATFLAAALALWALHHLDYPILRARGAWNPWGYFVDALFVLTTGVGILMLVLEEFRQGLVTLSALSGDLHRGVGQDNLDALLQGPLGLRGVRGAGLFRGAPSGPVLVRGSGLCEDWARTGSPRRVTALVAEVLRTGQSELEGDPGQTPSSPPFLAAIALGEVGGSPMVLAVAGDVAAAFAVLDQGILAAVGAQIGAGLRHVELDRALEQRSLDLERLSVRMIQQHEEQRRRIGRELHDETAQVFSALKLQLGVLKETAPDALGERFDRLVELVDVGSRSIRNVTEDLRPAVLDDLGLVPALRALVADFREWSGLTIDLELAETGSRTLTPAAELAMFRAVQEGLSNVARHAQARQAKVALTRSGDRLCLTVADDGVGIPADRLGHVGGPGRSGLFGMRERIEAEGGTVAIRPAPGGGLAVQVELPVGPTP